MEEQPKSQIEPQQYIDAVFNSRVNPNKGTIPLFSLGYSGELNIELQIAIRKAVIRYSKQHSIPMSESLNWAIERWGANKEILEGLVAAASTYFPERCRNITPEEIERENTAIKGLIKKCESLGLDRKAE